MAANITRKFFLRLTTSLAASVMLNSFRNDVNRLTMGNNDTVTKDNLILCAIPSSGEKIPAIGMGTWITFDAGNSEARRKDLKEVLRIFNRSGGKLIDSSPMYGSSEKVAGDLMTDLNIRKDTFVATKVWTTGQADGVAQMEQSIQKMQAGVIDLMQVHNLVDFQVHLPTLRQWKDEGKIRYIGITHYQVSAYPDLMELIKKEKLDFVQFNYNIRVREAEKRLLPFCQDNGVAVINNRPLDGGELFTRTQGKALPSWANDYDIKNWAQYFLKYIISHPAVTCAIPATSKPAHMEENMGASRGTLPDEPVRRKMIDYFDKL